MDNKKIIKLLISSNISSCLLVIQNLYYILIVSLLFHYCFIMICFQIRILQKQLFHNNILIQALYQNKVILFVLIILRQWKNLHLQYQLLIMQSFIVAIIFVILISSCLYLVQLFSIFIKHELLQSLVLNSMVSSIQTVVIRTDRIGQIGYNLFLSETQQLKNLYDFQLKYQIQVNSQVDDCLQSPHSQQFNSYQFCYGLYGQRLNSLNYSQILSYIRLQNQFVPFVKRKKIIAYYNIQYDKEIFFSQYQGQYIQDLDQSILNALQYINQSQSPHFNQQQLNQTGQVYLSLDIVPQSNIIIGSLLNQSKSDYSKLTQSEEYYSQRSLSALDSGLILTDTSNSYAFGMQFQNSSFTGFNGEQFQKIRNFANKNGTIINECQPQFQNKILCLININNKQQLAFSKNIDKTGLTPYYMVVIVDTIYLQRIEDDFNSCNP
ncbi:hypothetical protein pb186bvf_004973 [Paramecium bursaria]